MVLIGLINVNGLRNDIKRQHVFNWFKSKKYDIILVQEIHCENSVEEHEWAKDWNGTSLWCNGTCLSKGVAVFIKENSIVQISYTGQEDGSKISLKIQMNDTKIQVVNVYVANNPSERKHFIP